MIFFAAGYGHSCQSSNEMFSKFTQMGVSSITQVITLYIYIHIYVYTIFIYIMQREGGILHKAYPYAASPRREKEADEAKERERPRLTEIERGGGR
jgi:hypothetical protein